jgi:hypothetical protein
MNAQSLLGAVRMAVQWAGRSGQRAALAAVLFLAASPVAVFGHGGELELSVAPDTIAAGDEVTVSGEGFVAATPLELYLTGPNGDAHFENVTADGEGAFTRAVRIPGDITPGIYLVRAAGAGREASAELTVGAMAGMPQATQRVLPGRERPNAWRTVALVLFLGLGIAGLALARPGRFDVSVRPSA